MTHETARGKRIGGKALANLSKDVLSPEEFTTALHALHLETDRGAAIMGAALVELSLTNVFEALIRNRDANEALFHDVGAPFGTFRAKTVVIYALGHCSKDFKREIDAIREIRNQFSHALRVIDFTRPEVAASCKILKKYRAEPKLFNAIAPKSQNRQVFEAACTRMAQSLNETGMKISKERLAELDKLIADLNASYPNGSE